MSDEPRIINTEEDLKHARALETSNDLDAMAATIRALWKERNSLTNLGCKAVDLTTEISEGAGKEIADLRAMVDTEVERVAELCRGEVDAVFIRTPHAVVTGTIERISKRLHEKLGEDTLVILLEGDASVEALSEETMRELGWVRISRPEAEAPDMLVIPRGAKRCPDCNGSGHFPRPKDDQLTGEFPAPIERAAIEALPCLMCNGLGLVDAVSLPGCLSPLPAPPTCERPNGDCPSCDDRNGPGCREPKPPQLVTPRYHPCPHCDGYGIDPDEMESVDGTPCPHCEGTGTIPA